MAQADLTNKKQTKSTTVYETVKAYIDSPERTPGERIVSNRKLAKELGISTFPIHQAMKQLEEEGYVENRHGAGTFICSKHQPITMADVVTLCMQTHGHLWSEMAISIIEALAKQGRIGTVLSIDDDSQSELTKRLAHSESNTIVVQAGGHFPWDFFDLPGMKRKTVVALLDWSSDKSWPGLYKILHDKEAAARNVAHYLKKRGHRNVLVVGTDTQVPQLHDPRQHDSCPAYAFRKLWEADGGTITAVSGHSSDTGDQLDDDAILKYVDADDTHRAVFGLRDYEAWMVQGILQRHRPELAAAVDIIGYGNTPWSQCGQPPFSTIDFNIDEVISHLSRIIEEIAAGKTPDPDILVPPKLIVR